MSETDFSEARVGDTVYRWQEPHKIIEIIAISPSVIDYPIRVDGGVRCSPQQTISSEWTELKKGVRCWFWQPVPEPIPPERPKRTIAKSLQCIAGFDGDEFIRCIHYSPKPDCDRVLRQVTITYEVEE